MSLEKALVLKVQTDPAVALIATSGGGFLAELPKNLLNQDGSFIGGAPTWTYIRFGGQVEHTLQAERGPRRMLLQIDCYGVSGGGSIQLADAIDNVLEGLEGPLYDTASPPNVYGIMSSLAAEEPRDTFDAPTRTWRRMLQYTIFFSQ